MIEIPYGNDIRRSAHNHALRMTATSRQLGYEFKSYKTGYNNSDETSYLGKIAEILFEKWLKSYNCTISKSPLTNYNDPQSNFNSDFIINSHTVELKTKTINCKPKADYDVGTTRISESEFYVFSRVDDSRGVLWLVGYINTNDFIKKATCRIKGTEVINSDKSSFICSSKEYILKINQLEKPELLISYLSVNI